MLIPVTFTPVSFGVCVIETILFLGVPQPCAVYHATAQMAHFIPLYRALVRGSTAPWGDLGQSASKNPAEQAGLARIEKYDRKYR